MKTVLVAVCVVVFYSVTCNAMETTQELRIRFIKDFIVQQVRPANIVSFLKSKSSKLSNFHPNIKIDIKAHRYNVRLNTIRDMDHDIYLVDLKDEDSINILLNASENNRLITPSRWILFYNCTSVKKNSELYNISQSYSNSFVMNDNIIRTISNKLAPVYVAINTEVYITLECDNEYTIFLVYKIRSHMELIWELFGTWSEDNGFEITRPFDVVAMRRLNLQRIDMVAIAVIHDNRTLQDMPDYRNMEIDTLPKYSYYMTIQLFDWLNVSGSINTTTSFGYIQPNGKVDGMIQELDEMRSDFCATVLFPVSARVKVVHFVSPPNQFEVGFLFRKPPLATVANIYGLPFSTGVWTAIVLLIIVSAITLGISTLWEMMTTQNPKNRMTITQRISKSLHDTFCLVFQQGIPEDPVSSSARQILLMGLMSFMFLYTAYSANVVALLQSVTSEINSVETLLKSPLQCSAEDVIYNRKFFKSENESSQRDFWLKKVAPHGENFYLPIAEGVRRMREGLHAFHVEKTAAFYQIQKTFFEHEKCNIDMIKYFAVPHAHTSVSRKSHSKEQLTIGVLRIMESGLQSRTNRRMTGLASHCSAGTAMFTQVSMLYVLPIYKYLLIVYITAVLLLGLEICCHRKEKRIARMSTLTTLIDDSSMTM